MGPGSSLRCGRDEGVKQVPQDLIPAATAEPWRAGTQERRYPTRIASMAARAGSGIGTGRLLARST